MSDSWIIDGQPRDESEATAIIASVARSDVLVRSGGMLFRARVEAKRIVLGLLPVVTGTQRNYHHEIDLGGDMWPCTVGTFSPDLSVQMLVPPEPGERLRPPAREDARFQIVGLCRGIISVGFPASRRFDEVTRSWFAQSGIVSHPVETVGDAAADADE